MRTHNFHEDHRVDGQYFIDNLDKAIENEWIKAYHQPLVRAASNNVSDEEAFARWEDPQYGTFNAAEFVPVLDKAQLTYKLDLYMVERVLDKMKGQAEHGLFVVPESVNISRSDFDCCDMVVEIIKRIDDAGFPRDKLSVELSERVVSSDVDYMKKVVRRFRHNGIRVWMDDYGSGYSSMLILLKIRFDLLKIDKVFVDQIERSDAGKIILTELIKTAMALGMDTVAESVETKKQAEFLKEVGCSKLQGYYYIRPVSLKEIIERNEKGIQIGFENPDETEYYEKLGKVNLYDLSISRNDEESLSKYFDTMPMVVFGLDDEKASFIRCNKSYREFVETYFHSVKSRTVIKYEDVKPGVGYYSFNAVRECAHKGRRMIIDDRTADGRTIQLFIRRVAVNPVTGVAAVAVVVLSISDTAATEGLTYNYVARALSEDYINLYFVDMESETFAEYSADGESRDITFKKLGERFFDLEMEAFDLEIYREDFIAFKKAFTKKAVEEHMKESGVYSLVTRAVIDGKPVYVNVKAVNAKGTGKHIIVGINNVDNQMKAREIVERAKEESTVYARIGALTGNFIYIFTVDPKTEHYYKYNPAQIVSDMGIDNEGENFFETIIHNAPKGIHLEDLDSFLAAFSRAKVFYQIKKSGRFEHEHRLYINGMPRYVCMRATIMKEEDEDKLIVGILDIDEQIRREQEYAISINAAEIKANLDELTGIKNKHAYAEMEKNLDEIIRDNKEFDFAVAVFDLNGLKQINDTLGHQAGDEFIKRGCDAICRIFKHSPVYRIGGDEFVVIAQGYDFLNIDSLMVKMRKHNIKNQNKGDVVIAAGMSRFNKDETVSEVFKRADAEMYRNKKELKKATT